MTDYTKDRLATITAPYGREVRLDDLRFESGMRLLRIVIREGTRITQLDIDAATAETWADAMKTWADSAAQSAPPEPPRD